MKTYHFCDICNCRFESMTGAIECEKAHKYDSIRILRDGERITHREFKVSKEAEPIIVQCIPEDIIIEIVKDNIKLVIDYRIDDVIIKESGVITNSETFLREEEKD